MSLNHYLLSSRKCLDDLIAADIDATVLQVIDVMASCLKARKPLLVFGNGGSAADASHIAGELVGRYKKERPAMNVIALTADSAITTAWANDYEFESLFERQVEAYGQIGGVALGISTSGNSDNVVRGIKQAKTMQMTTVALTGGGGGRLAAGTDFLIDVPTNDTPKVQELHQKIYHYICEQVELRLTEDA